MTAQDRRRFQEGLVDVEGLVLFQPIVTDAVGEALTNLLYALAMERAAALPYVRLVRALWAADVPALTGVRLHDWLLDRLLTCENAFVRAAARGAERPTSMPASLQAAAQTDLGRLRGLLALQGEEIQAAALRTAGPEWRGALPPWPVDAASAGAAGDADPTQPARRALVRTLLADWEQAPALLAGFYRQHGSGIYARHVAFHWTGELQPVALTEKAQFQDLVGLQSTIDAVVANTEAFIARRPANHVLLYGDRGTGKSTLVRSLLTAYGGQGLRLVQLPREFLHETSRCLQALAALPLPTILFVDDLSFEETEAGYKSFKAALEGTLGGWPAHVRVYATSNRRQLVRQRFSERPGGDGDEVHPGDTLQEKLSLVDRFGIALPFVAPDQAEFLAIVHHLAPQYGIRLAESELDRQALLWVQQKSGRNGRSARQFLAALAGQPPEA